MCLASWRDTQTTYSRSTAFSICKWLARVAGSRHGADYRPVFPRVHPYSSEMVTTVCKLCAIRARGPRPAGKFCASFLASVCRGVQ